MQKVNLVTRKTTHVDCIVPSFRLSTNDRQAFPVAIAKICNALPDNVVSVILLEL